MKHHHYERFVEEDFQLDNVTEFDEYVSDIDYVDDEKLETGASRNRYSRRAVEDYLEQKRMSELDKDPFDEFFSDEDE